MDKTIFGDAKNDCGFQIADWRFEETRLFISDLF